jgi:spore coat polysaccharide biosynthesis protein SpsF
VILAVIQARLGSARFPRKVLAEMPDGRLLIQHVVERVRKIKAVDDVVLAVPSGQVVELGYCANVYGPDVEESDVLGRFAAVAERWPDADTLLRVTCDCPMLQPDLCDELIKGWRESGVDYGWIDTSQGDWPDGWDCEVFTRDLLMQAHMQATDAYDREHVTPIMRRMRDVYSLPGPTGDFVEGATWPKYSIDEPSDLERVREFMRRDAATLAGRDSAPTTHAKQKERQHAWRTQL